jgi:hypothetical protein
MALCEPVFGIVLYTGLPNGSWQNNAMTLKGGDSVLPFTELLDMQPMLTAAFPEHCITGGSWFVCRSIFDKSPLRTCERRASHDGEGRKARRTEHYRVA